MSRMFKVKMLRSLLGSIGLAVLCAPRAAAHNGPPFPIITDQRIGPYTVSLWTHPDLGTGTFFVLINPPSGGVIPKDLKIQIAICKFQSSFKGMKILRE